MNNAHRILFKYHFVLKSKLEQIITIINEPVFLSLLLRAHTFKDSSMKKNNYRCTS